jgi:hypothetical protein
MCALCAEGLMEVGNDCKGKYQYFILLYSVLSDGVHNNKLLLNTEQHLCYACCML